MRVVVHREHINQKLPLSMNNNRIHWIDIVRGICIFCVVLTHVETCPDSFRWFFSPHYMPMFFFLSGVVYKPSANVAVAILQPVTKILWPYVISAVIFAFGSLGWIRALLDADYSEALNILFHNFYNKSFLSYKLKKDIKEYKISYFHF